MPAVFYFVHDGKALVFSGPPTRFEDLYRQRDKLNSDAGRFLAALEFVPHFKPWVSSLTKRGATAVMAQLRTRAKKEGHELLTFRDKETYAGGIRPARVVIDDAGREHPSIRQCARTLGIGAATVCQRIRNGKYLIM